MAILIDTNIAIRLRDGDPAIALRVSGASDAIVMSVITRVELEGGVYRLPEHAAIRRARLDAMLRAIAVVPYDDAAAEAYGRIVSVSGYSRRKILDRMIAAQCIVLRASLATGDAGDFADVPGLAILSW